MYLETHRFKFGLESFRLLIDQLISASELLFVADIRYLSKNEAYAHLRVLKHAFDPCIRL